MGSLKVQTVLDTNGVVIGFFDDFGGRAPTTAQH